MKLINETFFQILSFCVSILIHKVFFLPLSIWMSQSSATTPLQKFMTIGINGSLRIRTAKTVSANRPETVGIILVQLVSILANFNVANCIDPTSDVSHWSDTMRCHIPQIVLSGVHLLAPDTVRCCTFTFLGLLPPNTTNVFGIKSNFNRYVAKLKKCYGRLIYFCICKVIRFLPMRRTISYIPF